MRACDVTAHGRLVPFPSALRNRPEDLQAKIERCAAQQFFCQYLGERQGEVFEPDPRKWSTLGPRAIVWFEWNFVTIKGEPHRVSMRVNRMRLSSCQSPTAKIPGNPLRRFPPTLTFSMTYLQKFAEQKCPGAIYEGFASGLEAPSIDPALPNGGENIQHWPLIWSLPPDGRSLHVSLMDFKEIISFEAPPPGSDEAHVLFLLGGWSLGVSRLARS